MVYNLIKVVAKTSKNSSLLTVTLLYRVNLNLYIYNSIKDYYKGIKYSYIYYSYLKSFIIKRLKLKRKKESNLLEKKPL